MIRPTPTFATAALACSVILCAAPAQEIDQAAVAYRDYESIREAADALAAQTSLSHVEVLATTGEGRDVILLTLTQDHGISNDKPALLIVAGLDARHHIGVETSLRVAKRLVENHAELLNDVTVYVVPCANPDGLMRNLGEVNFNHIGNLRSVDEDRDGDADEDGPADLNGDGFITQMRRVNPPLDDPPTHLADPAEPRLLKKPDPEKGERPIYSVYIEGLDEDGDGRVAEDAPGMVDLDRNFMHLWPDHALDAGATQISEPESLALANFVLEHRNIVASIVYGRHDNLINVPEGKDKDITGEAPKDLHKDDVKFYKEIAKKYKEVTGHERTPKPAADLAGSFHAWLYAQRGIPTFATVVWGRPDPPKETKQENAEQEDEKNDDTAQEVKDDVSDAESDKETEVKKEEKKKKDDEPKPADEDAAAWLKYSDEQRDGEGFIDWQPFDHPTLGEVEIGGFVPGFQMNPPVDVLDDLAGKQTAFAVEIISRRPTLTIDGPEVKQLSAGLYEVRLGLVNEGYLPTATAQAREARSLPPTVVRLSTEIDDIVAGERVNRVWGIGGSGDRSVHHWIIRADEGTTVTIEIVNSQLGSRTIEFTATDGEDIAP